MKAQFRRHCTLRDQNFKDMVLGLFTLAFFITMLLLIPSQGGTANQQAMTSGATARTYPYIISVGGVVVSAWLIISKLMKISAVCKKEAAMLAEGEDVAPMAAGQGSERWKMVMLCVAMMFVLNLLLIKLGVILGGFLYLLAQILILTGKGKLTVKNIVIAVVISVAVPLAIYFPFTYIFKAKIPMGIFK